MNFTRNSSQFFKGKTIKSFCQNKFSCNFFNSKLNKFSSKNFITFSNLFFLTSIQKMVLTSRSLGMQASSIITGSIMQGGENPLESSATNLEKLSQGINNMNECILFAKSINLHIIKKYFNIENIYYINFNILKFFSRKYMAIDDYFKHCESNGSIGNNYFTM
jgi:hypothetical protein